MKRFSRARRALATLCFVLGIPGLASGHGDEPHGSHDASFGGLVMMYIDLHFEVVLPEEGGVQLYYSDATRAPLPAAVVSDVLVEILRKDAPAETVVMSASDAGDYWLGNSMPVTSPETIVRISFVFQDEPVVFELPARLFPAFMEKMQESMSAHQA